MISTPSETSADVIVFTTDLHDTSSLHHYNLLFHLPRLLFITSCALFYSLVLSVEEQRQAAEEEEATTAPS